MACQCYLNFVAADATAASCPKTGVCTHALDLKQVILLDIGQDFRYWIWMLGLIPWKITLIAKIPVFRTKSGHFWDSLWLERSHFMFYIKSDSFFSSSFRRALCHHALSRATPKFAPSVMQRLETPFLTGLQKEMDSGQTPTMVFKELSHSFQFSYRILQYENKSIVR